MNWKDKKYLIPLLIFMTGNVTGGVFQTITLGSVALADIERHDIEIKQCKDNISECDSRHRQILNEIHNGNSQIKDLLIDYFKARGHEHTLPDYPGTE